MSTVSIAMCTYNGAGYLQQQLDSIAQQTHKPDEIIVCDDASDDDSLSIAYHFAQHSGLNVRIHQNTRNLGYVKNFEKAMSLCTQDLVFLCDQDDLWQPRKIEQIVDTFDAEQNVGLILHDFSWIDENNQHYPGPIDTYGPMKLSSNQLPQEIKDNSICIFMEPYPRAWCGCMMAYRRSFHDILLPIFPGKGHDDWILKVLAPVTDTRFIAESLIYYRMHQRNTNRRDLEKRTIQYLLGRLIKKASLALKGHTKRHFYRQVSQVLNQSGRQIKYPKLVEFYKRYI